MMDVGTLEELLERIGSAIEEDGEICKLCRYERGCKTKAGKGYRVLGCTEFKPQRKEARK